MKRHRNIRRFDDDSRNTHGWFVQVQRNHRIFSKMFSDGVHGSKKKAFDAALAYRDECIAVAGPKHKVWRCNVLRRNNTSGIPGVARYEVAVKSNSTQRRAYWLAFWTDEHGISHKRKFFVSRYGERKAKQFAVATRTQELARIGTIKSARAYRSE